jgi:hypothetical protein
METSRYAYLLIFLSALPGAVSAQQTPVDIVALQQRISELEAQNLVMHKQLADLGRAIQALNDNHPQQQAEQDSPAALQEYLPQEVLAEGNKSRISFYGFMRADAIFDDSRPDALQTPLYINSEVAGSSAADNSSFTLHPRLTRLGINYNGPIVAPLAGAKLNGKFELDFQNGGRESRAVPRYRHAYTKLDWGSNALLIGQTWDIISPLYPTVNPDTMMWNAGNLGDRRMQIRYTYSPDNPFSLQAGVGLTGAVNSQDLDGNGIQDGQDSSFPHLQARLGYHRSLLALGLWGHYAREETELAVGGENDFDSYSIGVDFSFNPLAFASMKGELWIGSGLGDFRGGIGQSINALTGNEIDSYGGWIEFGLQPTARYSITAGITVDNPANEQLATGARKLNRSFYVTNQLRPGNAFMIGLDYIHWQTDYIGLPEGVDNRFNLYGVYYF